MRLRLASVDQRQLHCDNETAIRAYFRWRLLNDFAPYLSKSFVSAHFAFYGTSLRGIISQQLVPSADGKTRVLALETLTNTPAVANVIREARTYMLPGIIQTGKKQGMQLMDDALMALSDRGAISSDEAYARAEQKQAMEQHLSRE